MLPDIDEDPFAHFISPVTEEDDPYEEYDFNAGISTPDLPPPTKSKSHKFRTAVAKRWERYLSHHHHNRHRQNTDSDPDDLLIIDDDAADADAEDDEKDSSDFPLFRPSIPSITITHPTPSASLSPSPSSSPPLLTFSDIEIDSDPPTSCPSSPEPLSPSLPLPLRNTHLPRRRKGRRRMHSGPRPPMARRHAWREPSAGLFTVMEEGGVGGLKGTEDVQMEGGFVWTGGWWGAEEGRWTGEGMGDAERVIE